MLYGYIPFSIKSYTFIYILNIYLLYKIARGWNVITYLILVNIVSDITFLQNYSKEWHILKLMFNDLFDEIIQINVKITIIF